MKCIMQKEKETKGTQRYKECVGDEETPVIGTLYIKKTAAILFGGTFPERIRVEVTSVND